MSEKKAKKERKQKKQQTTELRERMIQDLELRNRSSKTISSYIRKIAEYAKFFNQSPELLGPEEIRTFQLYLIREKDLGASSLNVYASALRFLYGTTLRRKWIVERVAGAKTEKKLPVVLSQEELARFFGAINSLKYRAILVAAYAGGLRIEETVQLKPENIDRERMVMYITGKGSKDRYVMLSPKLYKLLRMYWTEYRPDRFSEIWMFPNQQGSHISPASVREVCKKACHAAGIKKRVTPHSLRHAFATHLLEGGVDILKIQVLMGHKSLTTTARYVHVAIGGAHKVDSPLETVPIDFNPQS